MLSLASWDVYSYGERDDQFSGLLPGHQIFIDLGGGVEAEIRRESLSTRSRGVSLKYVL